MPRVMIWIYVTIINQSLKSVILYVHCYNKHNVKFQLLLIVGRMSITSIDENILLLTNLCDRLHSLVHLHQMGDMKKKYKYY